MNYIELINRFWNCSVERAFNPSDAMLYFYLLNTCNTLHWKQPFGQSDRYLSLMLGISVPTVRNAKNRLKLRGVIDFKAPSRASRSFEGQTRYWFPSVKGNSIENSRNSLDVDCSTMNTNAYISTASVFAPPAIEDVYHYFIGKGLSEDNSRYRTDSFYNFYGSKDWMVGKNKMANWKLAAIKSLEWEDKRMKGGRNGVYKRGVDGTKVSDGRKVEIMQRAAAALADCRK